MGPWMAVHPASMFRVIWESGPAAPEIFVLPRERKPAPDLSSGINFSYFSVPALDTAGQTAFQAQLSGSGVNNTNDYGIWSEGSGDLALVREVEITHRARPAASVFATLARRCLMAGRQRSRLSSREAAWINRTTKEFGLNVPAASTW